MRKIKFRAWHKRHGMSFSEESFEPIYGMQKFHGSPANDFDGEEFTLMQYTGLKDKNRKEIYEGDIVRLGTHEALTAVVEFDEEYAQFTQRWLYENLRTKCDMPAHNSKKSEPLFCNSKITLSVIGNIYENPELLKESV